MTSIWHRSIYFFLFIATVLFSIFSCKISEEPSWLDENAVPPTNSPPDVSLPAAVKRVWVNSSGYGSVTLTGLSNNDIYLVRANASDSQKGSSVASLPSIGEEIAYTGSVRMPAGTITIDGKTLTRYELQWQVVIPPEYQTTRMLNLSETSRSTASDYAAAQVGDTKLFYVNQDKGNITKTATLKKIGKHCKIWVVGVNFDQANLDNSTDNKVNQKQVDTLADKFDAIYSYETNLLGYEYGGGPGENGGADGDQHIQILVYDIDGDFGKSRTEATFGYFYPGDEYGISSIYPWSNEAEIFYLDSEMMDSRPDAIYSTLIHEFNHMINLNVKVLETNNDANWEAWYTEMLSMLAEDAVGPLVGIPYDSSSRNGHVILERIPDWLYNHSSYSAMNWGQGVGSYSSNYAFGAYLVRNFGGPELLSHIAKSDKGGIASLNESLGALNNPSVDIQYALARFGETLMYSGSNKPAGVYSFDNTVSGEINDTEYTFAGFDVWAMNYSAGGKNYKGPQVLSSGKSIPPNGIQIISQSNWKSKSGNFAVQITNGNSDVYNFVMFR